MYYTHIKKQVHKLDMPAKVNKPRRWTLYSTYMHLVTPDHVHSTQGHEDTCLKKQNTLSWCRPSYYHLTAANVMLQQKLSFLFSLVCGTCHLITYNYIAKKHVPAFSTALCHITQLWRRRRKRSIHCILTHQLHMVCDVVDIIVAYYQRT